MYPNPEENREVALGGGSPRTNDAEPSGKGRACVVDDSPGVWRPNPSDGAVAAEKRGCRALVND